jgi:hypothetical protein
MRQLWAGETKEKIKDPVGLELAYRENIGCVNNTKKQLYCCTMYIFNMTALQLQYISYCRKRLSSNLTSCSTTVVKVIAVFMLRGQILMVAMAICN